MQVKLINFIDESVKCTSVNLAGAIIEFPTPFTVVVVVIIPAVSVNFQLD
jgi:hypothetical protein